VDHGDLHQRQPSVFRRVSDLLRASSCPGINEHPVISPRCKSHDPTVDNAVGPPSEPPRAADVAVPLARDRGVGQMDR
jgi:hypothetical protein